METIRKIVDLVVVMHICAWDVQTCNRKVRKKAFMQLLKLISSFS